MSLLIADADLHDDGGGGVEMSARMPRGEDDVGADDLASVFFNIGVVGVW